MSRWKKFFGIPLCCAATLAAAQAPVRPTDPIFVRAQALVSDGNGVAGRALIDSVIAATQPTARLYPEALFWRASLASNAADAESDYKHIVVDYPLAPQAEDALLRLAQLELARGDRDAALGHLQRIPRDYPRSKSLARASYWTARVLFEKNDVASACAANANALSQADASEVELKNQIQYQGQRCPSATVAAVNPPTTVAPAEKPTAVDTASSSPVTASSTPKAIPPRAVASVPRIKPPEEANDSKPSIVDPGKTGKVTAEKSATKAIAASPVTPKPVGAASRGNGYSVQVAAYQHKPEAEKLTTTLNKRGYSARVDESDKWFRVRIGRYATEKEAEDALKKIKASHMEGFVVRAPER